MPQSYANKFIVIIRFALAVWLALLIAVSLFPLAFKLKLHTSGPFHDYVHYIAFILTAIFLWLITERPSGKVFSFFGGIAFSYAQEWAENRIYHAGFEWRDVATDLVGLMSGYVLMLLVTFLPD